MVRGSNPRQNLKLQLSVFEKKSGWIKAPVMKLFDIQGSSVYLVIFLAENFVDVDFLLIIHL